MTALPSTGDARARAARGLARMTSTALAVPLDRFAPEGVVASVGTSVAIAAEASNLHPALAPIPTLKRRRPDATVRPSAAPRRAPPRRAVGVACAVLLATLVLGGRERIVARVPAADRLFAAIGLPVNLAGVEFRNVVSKVAEIDGQKVLAVTGEIVSLRASASALPGLTLTARGSDGRALYVWTAHAGASKLGPGETTTFRTRLASPPEEARDVLVALADPARQIAQAEPAAKASTGRLAGK